MDGPGQPETGTDSESVLFVGEEVAEEIFEREEQIDAGALPCPESVLTLATSVLPCFFPICFANKSWLVLIMLLTHRLTSATFKIAFPVAFRRC